MMEFYSICHHFVIAMKFAYEFMKVQFHSYYAHKKIIPISYYLDLA